jgi:peptidoglycan/LPS O-acetylase OafA/YrhL
MDAHQAAPKVSVRAANNFEIVRLLAAVMVVYGHAFPLTGTSSPVVLGVSVQAMAVKVFFIISGFLVTQSWINDPSAVRYAMRRGLRILPGLLVVTVLTVLICGLFVSSLDARSFFASPATWRFFSNVVFEPNYSLPGVFGDNIYRGAVNGSLWSLPVEVSMYLLMPLALSSKRFGKLSLIAITLALCASSLYVTRILNPVPRVVYYGTDWAGALDVAPYFFLGAVWYAVLPPKFFNLQIAFVLLLISCAVPAVPLISETFLYLFLPYVILSFSTMTPGAFGFLNKYGDLSYGVYIYGFFCEQLISGWFKTDQRPLHNFAWALPMTLVLAYLSWNIVERRFLRLKPRRTRPQRPVAPAVSIV